MKRNPKQYAHHLAAYAIDEHLKNSVFCEACKRSEEGEFIAQELTKLRDEHDRQSGPYAPQKKAGA
jgi:hypothetical protein